MLDHEDLTLGEFTDDMSTTHMLDLLAELEAKRDTMNLRYDEREAAILAPVMDQLLELRAEKFSESCHIDDRLSECKARITARVLAVGQTAKGERYMAMWVKGRTTWDSKALDAYMRVNPEIAVYRKEGEPSVSFRHVNGS